MKKILGIFLLVSMLLLTGQSFAFAQKGGHFRGLPNCAEGAMNPFLLSSLNLSGEQKAALWDVLFDTKRVPRWKSRGKLASKIVGQTLLEKPVDEKTKVLLKERIEEQLMARYRQLAKVYSILKPEQRAMFKVKFEKHFGEPGRAKMRLKVKHFEQGNDKVEHFFLMSKLNLTPAQQAKVKVIMKEAADKVRMNRVNLHDRFAKMFHLIWKDKPDWKELRLESKVASREIADNIITWQRAFVKVQRELTPEQKSQLMEYFKDRDIFNMWE